MPSFHGFSLGSLVSSCSRKSKLSILLVIIQQAKSEHFQVHTCAEDMAQHTTQLLTISQKLILHIMVLLLLLNHYNLSVRVCWILNCQTLKLQYQNGCWRPHWSAVSSCLMEQNHLSWILMSFISLLSQVGLNLQMRISLVLQESWCLCTLSTQECVFCLCPQSGLHTLKPVSDYKENGSF